MKNCYFLLLSIWISLPLLAQSTNDRPNLFIDCNTRCDMVYVKQEMTFVNYAQDRQAADVFVLATDQSASGGNREIQFIVTGQDRFDGSIDTIQFYREANVSDAKAREQFLKNLKKGLLPYVIQTDLVNQLEYSVETSDTPEVTKEEDKDPWNNWSFSVR